MPFDNPLVAGETLVRAAISSPDYVQSVSGWTVRGAGYAEFGDVYIRGAGGRYIRAHLNPSTIPLLDFHPADPTTPGWSVDAGSVYEYNDGSGHEVLGLASPQQYQPTATGEALIDMKSGSATDAPQIVLTAPEVVINGTLLNSGGVGGYQVAQSGTALVTLAGFPTYEWDVVFPTAFPIGTVPHVFVNIDSSTPATEGCGARARAIDNTRFRIFVETYSGAPLGVWTNEPVSWIAFLP